MNPFDAVALKLNRRIIELEEQNAALLVAIEAKDAALKQALGFTGSSCIDREINKALALSPSISLLEVRDRKRDAKLLRVIANSGALSTEGVKYVFQQANARADGSWKPELGD